MMNNNKILTVSYGTFSCTLEGFDDSFDTMKAIAEYFRDLASDDRYFGAEPPQPDAEMLARIAEREVARRVEARENDGRILLKAHDDEVQPTAKAEAPAAAAAVAAADLAEPQEVAPETAQETASEAETEADEPEAVAEPVEEATEVFEADADADADEESAAEGENSLENALVEESDATPADIETTSDLGTAEITDPEVEPVAEPIEAVERQEKSPEMDFVAEDTSAQQAFDEEVLEQDVALNAEAFFADSPAPSDIDPEIEAEMEVPSEFTAFEPVTSFEAPDTASEAAAETIAAKLQRIREVVSQQDDEAYDEEETSPSDEPVDILDMPFDEAVQSPEEHAAEDTTEEVNAALNEAAQDIEEAFEVDDQIASETEDAPEEEDDLSAVLSRLEADHDDGEDSLLGTDDEEVTAQDAAENLFGDSAETVEDAQGERQEATEVKGRVLKVDRADLEAALEAGDLEEFDGADAATLSDEEEADLQRELDAVTAETDQPQEDKPAARDTLPAIDSGTAEDVSRLMAEADQQMEEPEGATRRSAFAHLRAAVAARFADKTMTKEETEEENTKAYRSDLAQVVKPRRPVASGNRTERPAEPRPTPLKLVAEQRIDENLTGADPVTPRRVAATLEDDMEFAEDTGFAEFAEQMGATKLPEVLEAAAAYLSYVEGHDQFSRPQLMTRVRQADCGEFSREDGLRSFGQLLRAGKIEKIKGGRFAASDAIGFKPDERAAG
ncbi:hypothetical protein [uncultured Roseobacter sp.]|uniref:hypothetical protein n=1 Tax=uncultured Roseobacter sp. TaxID=114847 RepID=UPI002627F563|nr:hypothetical protein [uncultured Roseobacter sp.]